MDFTASQQAGSWPSLQSHKCAFTSVLRAVFLWTVGVMAGVANTPLPWKDHELQPPIKDVTVYPYNLKHSAISKIKNDLGGTVTLVYLTE